MADNVTERWYFTKAQLKDTPSRRCDIDEDKELSYRQQAATLIQDMGQRLSVSQLTINTAIVYMHRFYMFHSFSKVHRNVMAPCCLFLAAKVEEQPRKLEHVIRVAHACLHREGPPLDPKSEEYMQKAQDLVENESVLLQTLGFEVSVHHPHTYVVKCIQLVRGRVASKDLGQTSYFMATNSLHLTTFCLQYKPSTVACACIHLACKWSNWEIPKSSDNKDWWEYIDPSVTKELLDGIAQQFLHIMEKCPNRLKRKVNSVTIYKGGVPLPPKSHKSDSSSTAASNSTSANVSSTMSSHQNSVDGEHNGTHTNSTAHMNSVDHSGHRESSLRKDNVKEKVKAPTVSLSTNGSGTSSLSVNVSLPILPPLTTKYANVTATASAATKEHKATVHVASSLSTSSGISGKHKHRHSEASPAKKHKSSHSHSSHSHSSHSHSLHPSHKSSHRDRSHSSHRHSSSSSAKKQFSSSSSKLSHLPPPPPPLKSPVTHLLPIPPLPTEALPSSHDMGIGSSSSSVDLPPFSSSTLSPSMFPMGLLTNKSSNSSQLMNTPYGSSSGSSTTLNPHDLNFLFGQQQPPPPPPPKDQSKGVREFPPLPPSSPSPPPPPPPPFPR